MKVMNSLKNEEGEKKERKGSEWRLHGVVERSWDLDLGCLSPDPGTYQLWEIP